MNSSLDNLAKKRQDLVDQAQMQRLALAEQMQAWHQPISLLDYAINIVRYLKQHPLLLATGGSALLSVLKPSALRVWLQRGLLVWQLVSRFRKKQQNN